MATYDLQPMPDADRVWWLRPGVEPLMLTRSGDEGFAHELPNGDRLAFYYWHELFVEGAKVTTDDPDDTSWLPPGPWTAKDDESVVRDASGNIMASTARVPDHVDSRRLAAFIARAVNKRVARHAEGPNDG